MRTTVTLDPDVEDLLRRTMRERGITFRQAVNDAIRHSARQAPSMASAETDFPTFDMGEPLVDLTHALRIAGELEDLERARDLAEGS